MTAPPAGALEACLALLEKATPERWGASGEERVVVETLTFCGDVSPVLADGEYRGDIASIQSCNHIGKHGIGRAEAAANAQLIAAAVNLLKDHGPALLAALRLREWRPIAEAPKDGRSVLIFCKGAAIPAIAFFCEDAASWMSIAGESFAHPIIWMPAPIPTADDLARVLEESATGDEAGSG